MPVEDLIVTPDMIKKASNFFVKHYGRNPLVHFRSFKYDGLDVNVYAQCEHVGPINAFKARGAHWAIHNLEQRCKKSHGPKPKIVAASAGNHAQGVALAAQKFGFESVIYMPEATPLIKKERVQSLGAEIQLIPGTVDKALEAAKEFDAEMKDLTYFIHPYEDPLVVAGQGGIAHDIFYHSLRHTSQLRHDIRGTFVPDVILCGLGGGGMSSGIGIAVKERNKKNGYKTKVIGIVHEAADGMYISMEKGMFQPESTPSIIATIADGINVKSPSEKMYNLLQQAGVEVLVATEQRCIEAIRDLYHSDFQNLYLRKDPKRVVSIEDIDEDDLFDGAKGNKYANPLCHIEGAAAAPLSVVLSGDRDHHFDLSKYANGKDHINVVVVLSGANIHWEKLRYASEIGLPSEMGQSISLNDYNIAGQILKIDPQWYE